MSILGLTGLVNALTCILLGVFVLAKNTRSSQNISYFVLNVAVALYSFGYFFWQLSDNLNSALFWFKILAIGFILINNAYLLFVVLFLRIFAKHHVAILACLAINLFFIFLNINNGLYTTLVPKYNLGYWPVPTSAFHFYLGFWFLQCFYGFYLLLMGQKITSGHRRSQIKYFTLAAMIGFVGGATNWPMWYNIHFPPYSNILISIYIGVVAYAIVRHNMMDIEVIVKKAVVFTSLLLTVFTVFVGITMTAQEMIAGGRLWGLAISSALIILILRPLEIFLVNVTDRYLFQKKYNPLRMIHDFSQAVLTELDLNKITKQTVDIISEALRVESCAVLIPSKEGDKFVLKESRGVPNKEYFIEEKSPLVFQLNSSSVVMVQTDEMKRLGAVICLGIVIRKNLISILALGRKKSDEDYSQEDIGVLNILADALGVAITNAVAYEELRHKANLVTIGTLASGIKHDISKPIDHMDAVASDLMARLRQGQYTDPAQMLNEAGNIIEKCRETFRSVISISEKYASKPKESEKRVILDVGEEVDAALSVVQHRIDKVEIKVKKQIPENLPKINFDKDYLRQILDNILSNAIDAIEAANRSKEDAVISVGAGEVVNRTLNIRLEISDTGTGIPEKIRDKIFKSWFTTKGEKGTGLGLALVSELVMRGGGTVEVESQEGKGSTFILGFKGIR